MVVNQRGMQFLLLLLCCVLGLSVAQDVVMVAWSESDTDAVLIKDGKTSSDDSTSLPVPQHQSYLRISGSSKASVEKMVEGLQIRSLDSVKPGVTPVSARHQLLVDTEKPNPERIASVGDHFEALVEITYVCGGQPGTYLILGTIPSNTNKMDVLIFKWKKTCGNGLLYGFNVATADNQDIVVNGDVVPSFRQRNHQDPTDSTATENTKLHHVGYTQDTFDLVVKGPSTTGATDSRTDSKFSLSFNVTALRMFPTPEKAGLSVVLEGDAASGGRIEVGDTIGLSLLFDCLITGTTTLELDFTVSNNRHLVSTMSFQKSCHVGPLPGFDILPSGIESLEALVVKDGQARPTYAKHAPLALVPATQTSVDFDIFTAREGLSIPIKAIWTTTTDFEIQQDPVNNDLPWLYNKNRFPKQGGPFPPRPGRGSVFGSSGSVLDALTKKLFNHGAVPLTNFPTMQSFNGLNGLFQRFHGGDRGQSSKEGGNNGNRRGLWKPNVREKPAEIPSKQERSRVKRPSVVAKTSVSGTAVLDKTYLKRTTKPTTPTAIVYPTVTPTTPLTLNVIHDCMHSGSVVVTVNILVVPQNVKILDGKEDPKDTPKDTTKDTTTTGPTAAATKDAPSIMGKYLKKFLNKIYNNKNIKQKIVSFSYVKECLVGSIPGLDISMGNYQPGIKMGGYALYHGLVTPTFMTRANRGRSKMVVREGELISNFYITLNNADWSVILRNVTIFVSHGDDVMDVDVNVLSATGAQISTWKPHEPIVIQGTPNDKLPRILNVNYNCWKTGNARVAMTLTMIPTNKQQVLKERALTMSWDKQCRVPPLKGLMVDMKSVTNAEKTKTKSIHVVEHGTPTLIYRPGIHSASIGKKWNSAHFQMTMEENATMPIAKPFVVSNNGLTEPSITVLGTNEWHDDSTMYLQQQRTIGMDLTFNCAPNVKGSSIVTVVIPLRPPLKQDISTAVRYPVDISFVITKRCGASKTRSNKIWKFLKSSTGMMVATFLSIGLFVCMGVVCCPNVILNMRAKLCRANYKYKRVKLDEDDEDHEESSMMTRTSQNSGSEKVAAIEMRSRKRGDDHEAVMV